MSFVWPYLWRAIPSPGVARQEGRVGQVVDGLFGVSLYNGEDAQEPKSAKYRTRGAHPKALKDPEQAHLRCACSDKRRSLTFETCFETEKGMIGPMDWMPYLHIMTGEFSFFRGPLVLKKIEV